MAGWLGVHIWQTGADRPSAIIPCVNVSWMIMSGVGQIWAEINLLSGYLLDGLMVMV